MTTTHRKTFFKDLPIGADFVILPEGRIAQAVSHHRKVSDSGYRSVDGNRVTGDEKKAEPGLIVREVVGASED